MIMGPAILLRRLLTVVRQPPAAGIRSAHFKKNWKRTEHPLTPPRSIRPVLPSRSAPAPVVYTHTNLKVAIVGRPNVGKSTLFNRLASAVRGRGGEGRSNPAPLVFVRSVVDAVPGVTRDPREASAALSDLLLTVVDTAGLETAVGDKVSSDAATAVGPQNYAPLHQKNPQKSVALAAASALCNDPDYREIYRKMEAGTVAAVNNANVVFFVVDASQGVTPIDQSIAKWLRTCLHGTSKQVLLIANKCDVADAEQRVIDAYSLGFGDPLALSAEQGLGFADLYAEIDRLYEDKRQGKAALLAYDSPWKRDTEEPEPFDAAAEEEESAFDDELIVACRERPGEEPLRQLIVSIFGRPNVGKSTLMNRLAGEERSIVGPIAGVTRDAVLCEWALPDKLRKTCPIPVWLVDTAGVRAQTKVLEEHLELLSVRTSIRALRHSHVVVMVLDAREPLVQQDTKILDLVVTEGRAAVLVVNKMDKLDDEVDMKEWRLQLRYRVDNKVSELGGIEVVEMSAKNWEEDSTQMQRLFSAVQRAWHRWEKRIPTAQLNRFVKRFNDRMSIGGGTRGANRNRTGVTKFVTQKKVRPPMFRLDGSSAVSLSYLRSLSNALRLEFGFEGVPIRVKRPSRRGQK